MNKEFPLVGEEFGRGVFKVLEGIGSGGQGTVYKASINPVNYNFFLIMTGQKTPREFGINLDDKSTFDGNEKARIKRTLRKQQEQEKLEDILCAMKFIQTDNLTEDMQKRFIQEGEMVALLRNEHIPHSLGCFLQRNFIYQVSEFVDAKYNFEDLEKPEKPDLVAHVGEGIAGALQYAHNEMNFIHRDIKPANVLVDQDDIVKVLDFGTAKILEGSELQQATVFKDNLVLTEDGKFMGTPYFMSPEQAEGKIAGKETDIYSLGATLYHLLSCAYPHIGSNPIQILQKIRDEKVKPLPKNVPPMLRKIILRMMAKEPERRPTASESKLMLKYYQSRIKIRRWLPELKRTLNSDEISTDLYPSHQTKYKIGVEKTKLRYGLLGSAAAVLLAASSFFGIKSHNRNQALSKGERIYNNLTTIVTQNVEEDKNTDITKIIKSLEESMEPLLDEDTKEVRTLADQTVYINNLDDCLDSAKTIIENGNYKLAKKILKEAKGLITSKEISDEHMFNQLKKLISKHENLETILFEKRSISEIESLIAKAGEQEQEGNYAGANENIQKASELFKPFSERPTYKPQQTELGEITDSLNKKITQLKEYEVSTELLNRSKVSYQSALTHAKEGKKIDDDVKSLQELFKLTREKYYNSRDILTEDQRTEFEAELKESISGIPKIHTEYFKSTSLNPVEKTYTELFSTLEKNEMIEKSDVDSLHSSWKKTKSGLHKVRKYLGEGYEPLQKRIGELESLISALPQKNVDVAITLFKSSLEQGKINEATSYFEKIPRKNRKTIAKEIEIYKLELEGQKIIPSYNPR